VPAALNPDSSNSPASRFNEILSSPEDKIDLAEAALLIAKSAYRDLDVSTYLGRIDSLGRLLRAQTREDATAAERIVALNRFLFGDQGFAPNIENYYDPRNSFLNEVLERRVGIPLTLSIVYIEVGRRVGLPLYGVSFPGHFLVKCMLEQGTVILDPYCGGISLALQDLQQRLREVRGGEVSRAIIAGMLVSASKKEILARMLRNLKAIYMDGQDYQHALTTLDWILLVHPEAASERRDRGLTYLKLECYRAALEDLEHYLQMSPGAEDSEQIRSHVVELRRSAARLH
jgi:regulator of sirC expression with transglutaminase-like and TPR domain